MYKVLAAIACCTACATEPHSDAGDCLAAERDAVASGLPLGASVDTAALQLSMHHMQLPEDLAAVPVVVPTPSKRGGPGGPPPRQLGIRTLEVPSSLAAGMGSFPPRLEERGGGGAYYHLLLMPGFWLFWAAALLAHVLFPTWWKETCHPRPQKKPPLAPRDQGSRLADEPRANKHLDVLGASYIMASSAMRSCGGTVLSIDVSSRAVWPLRVDLSRVSGHAPWSRINLMIDMGTELEFVPLFSSEVCSDVELVRRLVGEAVEGSPAVPHFVVWNFHGSMQAVVSPRGVGGVYVVRHMDGKQGAWEIVVSPLEGPWATVSCQGQEVAQITSLAAGQGGPEEPAERLRIDTRPESWAPESLQLLACLLAVVVLEQAR